MLVFLKCPEVRLGILEEALDRPLDFLVKLFEPFAQKIATKQKSKPTSGHLAARFLIQPLDTKNGQNRRKRAAKVNKIVAGVGKYEGRWRSRLIHERKATCEEHHVNRRAKESLKSIGFYKENEQRRTENEKVHFGRVISGG